MKWTMILIIASLFLVELTNAASLYPFTESAVLDDFEDASIDTDIWTTWFTAPASVTESNGRLDIFFDNSIHARITANSTKAPNFNNDNAVAWVNISDVSAGDGQTNILLSDGQLSPNLAVVPEDSVYYLYRFDFSPSTNQVFVRRDDENASSSPTATIDVSALNDNKNWSLRFYGQSTGTAAKRAYVTDMWYTQIGAKLISPIDGLTFSAPSLNFTSREFSKDELSNTTLNIWYANGSIFNQIYKSISGIFNISEWNITGFAFNSYLWNVYSCSSGSGINTTLSNSESWLDIHGGHGRYDRYYNGTFNLLINDTTTRSYDTTAPVRSSPVGNEEFIYFGSESNSIYQANASDITQIYNTYATGADVDSGSALKNGYLYSSSYDDYLYQFNETNISSYVNRINLGSDLFNNVMATKDYVYMGTFNGLVYQLNSTNISKIVNIYNVGDTIYGGPLIIDEQNDFLYVGSYNTNLYQLNLTNITRVVNIYTGAIDDYRSGMVIKNGYLYFGNYDDKFHQINATNITITHATFNTGNNIIYSTPAVTDKYFYGGSSTGYVYQLNASNISQKINAYNTGSQVLAGILATEDYIFVLSNNGNFYQLNATNITIKVDSKKLANSGMSSPTLINGVLYVGSDRLPALSTFWQFGNLSLNFTTTSPESICAWAPGNYTFIYGFVTGDQTFNPITYEGAIEEFKLNVTYNDTTEFDNVFVDLVYNGDVYSSEETRFGNVSEFSATVPIPSVDADTNLTFYWRLMLDSLSLNTTETNQSVKNLDVDDCSAFSNILFNFTVYKETNKTSLATAEVEASLNIYNIDRTEKIINFSAKKTNQLQFCLDQNITNLSTSSMFTDVVVKYYETDHAIEYYNVLNATFNSSFVAQHIRLYDLNLNYSTIFEVSFTGDDYLAIQNALVYLDREYVSENRFITVEAPLTDTQGRAILHMVGSDVRYNIRVIDAAGNLVGNFLNVVPYCPNPTFTDCTFSLSSISSLSSVLDYDTIAGLIFNTGPIYNDATKKISFDFIVPSGLTKTVSLNVTRNDVFGNRTVCQNSLTAASGTVACSVGNITDTQLISTVAVGGQTIIISSVDIDRNNFGSAGFAAWFVVSLVLILVFGESKNGMLISMIVSYVGAVALGLSKGSVVGIGAAGIWILIVTGLGVWRINKERQQ